VTEKDEKVIVEDDESKEMKGAEVWRVGRGKLRCREIGGERDKMEKKREEEKEREKGGKKGGRGKAEERP
jgi:hypothetical protein